MKNSKAVKLIALAHDQGYVKGYEDGRDWDQDSEERVAEAYKQGRREALSDEALAQAKSQAYEAGYAKAQEEAHKVGYQRGLAEGQAQAKSRAYEEGYKRGIEDQGKKTLELMTEARASERQKIEAAEPRLSVWFKPCGKSQFDSNGDLVPMPPGLNKINGIRAIREAYGSGEGYGLKEVKDLVETVSFGARYAAGQPLPQSKAVALYLQLQAAGFDPVLKS